MRIIISLLILCCLTSCQKQQNDPIKQLVFKPVEAKKEKREPVLPMEPLNNVLSNPAIFANFFTIEEVSQFRQKYHVVTNTTQQQSTELDETIDFFLLIAQQANLIPVSHYLLKLKALPNFNQKKQLLIALFHYVDDPLFTKHRREE